MVTARVEALDTTGSQPGYVAVEVMIESVETVPGFPDLMQWIVGQAIDVLCPSDQLGQLTPGTRVRGRVRKAGIVDVFLGPDGWEILAT